MDNLLDCQTSRRFGAEIELNTADGIVKKLDEDSGESPLGADYVAQIINKITSQSVKILGWQNTHNNDEWIVKPDSSCGIEVCTPVLKGWLGMSSMLRVIQAFSEDPVIKADTRCSYHIHVNVADLSDEQAGAIAAWWIKCEHVFFDAFPPQRKCSRYCQSVGMSPAVWHDFPMDALSLIRNVSMMKYYSFNAWHMIRGSRRTIEFRVADNRFCLDPFMVKNWTRLVLHFVEMAKNAGMPMSHKEGDPWSGLLWLDPIDVFKFLKFDQPISDGLTQVRNWFVEQIRLHGYNTKLHGIWSNSGRQVSRSQFLSLLEGVKFNTGEPEDLNEMLYGKKYIS